MLAYSISKYYAVTRQKRRTRRCFPPCSRIRHSKKGKRIRRTFLMANTPPYGQPQNGQPQYNQPPQPQAPNYSQPAGLNTDSRNPCRTASRSNTDNRNLMDSLSRRCRSMVSRGRCRTVSPPCPSPPVSTGGSTACDATICPIATIRSAATANARQLSFPASRRRGQK